MQSRNKTLLIILGAACVVVVIASCVAIAIGAGLIAWLVPTRVVTSTEVPPIEATVPTKPEPSPISEPSGLPVTGVRVETGVGSPAAVLVVVEGEFSSPCVQMEEIRTRYLAERQIHIEVLSSPDISTCPVANQGLFFLLRIPLNMVEMPSGRYSVNVNGVQADFDWPDSPSDPAGHFPNFDQPETAGLLPIPLQDAQVEMGVGSPIPVEVVLAGEWPNLCSQLARVRTQYGDQQFSIELLATPEDPTCPPDLLGLPFAMRIPLNMTNLEPGTYTVTANGLQATFDWPPTSGTADDALAPYRIAYIGPEGNVWVADMPEYLPRGVTTDATSPDASTPPSISYNDPQLSSDGKWIAYRRGEGIQQAEGMSMDFDLWVTDLATGEGIKIYDMSPSGFAWKPGTHLLAYIAELDGQYFSLRGDPPNAAFANPVMVYNADTGETSELVKPENGLSLYAPVWSPDGRFLSFDEVLYMEGKGPFAYYDFAAGEYIAIEQSLGFYSWSPDGETLAFDNMTYVASGEEYIQIRSRQDGSVSDFSANFDPGYALMPAFSPQGDRVAYFAQLSGPESSVYALFVQPFPQGEAVQLGEFENVYFLNWSPDGNHIVFHHGIYGNQVITEVNLETGERVEFLGMQPSLSMMP
jgi:Tol biopolymer transport system component